MMHFPVCRPATANSRTDGARWVIDVSGDRVERWDVPLAMADRAVAAPSKFFAAAFKLMGENATTVCSVSRRPSGLTIVIDGASSVLLARMPSTAHALAVYVAARRVIARVPNPSLELWGCVLVTCGGSGWQATMRGEPLGTRCGVRVFISKHVQVCVGFTNPDAAVDVHASVRLMILAASAL